MGVEERAERQIRKILRWQSKKKERKKEEERFRSVRLKTNAV